jgi:hypothetical protein
MVGAAGSMAVEEKEKRMAEGMRGRLMLVQIFYPYILPPNCFIIIFRFIFWY